MATATATLVISQPRTRAVRSAAAGSLAGIAASMVMAGYAMIASATYQHHGFFTPLYHIASTFISPSYLMTSMQGAMGGSTFDFFVGPAVLGAVMHMMIGAMYGAMFGVLVALARLRGVTLLAAGVLWGAAVFAISSFIALPIAASLFNSGDQITHMAKMVGYGTFLIEHVLFGLALAMLLALRRPAKSAAI